MQRCPQRALRQRPEETRLRHSQDWIQISRSSVGGRTLSDGRPQACVV